MNNPAMIVFICIFVLATSGVAGFCFFLALQSLFPSAETTRLGKIQRYCQAIEAWEAGGKDQLQNLSLQLRHGKREVECLLSSVPNHHDLAVTVRSDSSCTEYTVKVVRCNLARLLPLPVIDAEYLLEVLGTRPGGDVERLGEVVVQVLTDRIWDLRGNEDAECRRDAACLKESRKEECVELKGTPVDHDATRCLIHHRLIPAANALAPCWAFSTQPELGLYDLGWRPGAAKNQCTKPPINEKRLQHMVGTWMKGWKSNLQAMESILEESELTFRHQEDPYVVASQLTDSTFDMGPSHTEMVVFGSLMMVVAVCATGCCVGFCVGAARLASNKS